MTPERHQDQILLHGAMPPFNIQSLYMKLNSLIQKLSVPGNETTIT